jgi:REP element-mobilizing transposase RayT
MLESSGLHHRRSIRLSEYDYRSEGAYFVTICSYDRACLFGDIVKDAMVLNHWGEIVRSCWTAIPSHFPNIELDSFLIMPNHVHGIIVITEAGSPAEMASLVGAQHAAPSPKQPAVQPGSLGAIIRSFKSATTQILNKQRGTPGAKLWQRNYFEKIIRDQSMLDATRLYLETNPAGWSHDEENPLIMR